MSLELFDEANLPALVDDHPSSDEKATGCTDVMQPDAIRDVCEFRDQALMKMNEAIETLKRGYALVAEATGFEERAHCGTRFYLEDRTDNEHYKLLFNKDFDPDKSFEVYRKHVDACCWIYIIDRVGIEQIMDKTAKDELRASLLADVPEITFETVSSTIEKLLEDAELIFMRGIAKAFSELDRSFKSHNGFKIGSRIILTRVFTEWGHWNHYSHVRDTFIDIERVFAVLDGKPPAGGALVAAVEESRGGGFTARQSSVETEYMEIRGFKNGNAHFWFTRPDLVRKVNKILAGFYGEVVPDGMAADKTAEDLKKTANLLAKDLQFYPTPEDVVTRMLSDVYIREGDRVLEPSAGIGNIAFAAADKGARVRAIEIHPGRAQALVARGHPNVEVSNTNFLTMPMSQEFDYVLMNPPFFGTHWMDHVIHAFKFLKPGGKLIAVLPITAELGDSKRHKAFHKWIEANNKSSGGSPFTDLPMESFASVGTRINTVILEMKRGV